MSTSQWNYVIIKPKAIPTLIASYSNNIEADIVKRMNERLEMFRDLLGKVEQLNRGGAKEAF